MFGAGPNYSGEYVNVHRALGLIPYWRGINLRAGAIGMMPCEVFGFDSNNVRQPKPTSRAWQLLHELPNDITGMTSDEYWGLVDAHVMTWGNAFTWKEFGADNQVVRLWPLEPHRVQTGVIPTEDKAGNKTWQRVFFVDGRAGFTSRDIIHFRGLSDDGTVGYSPIQLHRNTLGADLSRQRFKGRFWQNNATPSTVLIHPNKINDDGIKRLKAAWKELHQGSDRAGEVAILQEKMDIKQLTMPLADAQFVQQEQLSATEQALMLAVPPSRVGGSTGGGLNYTSVQAEGIDFVKFGLGPSIHRYAKVVTWDQDIMPKSWAAKFKTKALLETTTVERYQAWELAHWMKVDEVRAEEGLEPLGDGRGEQLIAEVAPAKITLASNVAGEAPATTGGGEAPS